MQAFASSDANLRHALKTCAELADNNQRLSCFDQLVKPIVNASKKPTIKTTTAALPPINKQETSTTIVEAKSKPSEAQIKAQQEDDFAKEHIKKTDEQKTQEIKRIELTISKLSKLMHGEWKISFENGQKWQQKDTGRIRLKIGDKVTLEKGTLGAIYLKTSNSNKSIRVKRLK